MSHVRWAHRWENFVKNLNVTSQVLVSQTLLPTALWPSVCTSLLPAIRNVGSDARFCMPELTVWAHCLDSLPELTAWADYLSAHLSKPTLRSHSLWIHSISCPQTLPLGLSVLKQSVSHPQRVRLITTRSRKFNFGDTASYLKLASGSASEFSRGSESDPLFVKKLRNSILKLNFEIQLWNSISMGILRFL